jgi:hypothetical protein
VQLTFARFKYAKSLEVQPMFMDPLTYINGFNKTTERIYVFTNLKTQRSPLDESEVLNFSEGVVSVPFSFFNLNFLSKIEAEGLGCVLIVHHPLEVFISKIPKEQYFSLPENYTDEAVVQWMFRNSKLEDMDTLSRALGQRNRFDTSGEFCPDCRICDILTSGPEPFPNLEEVSKYFHHYEAVLNKVIVDLKDLERSNLIYHHIFSRRPGVHDMLLRVFWLELHYYSSLVNMAHYKMILLKPLYRLKG